MAVSKKLRYEVLRRDNYTCRYCGAFAPVTPLVVDHVVPRSRGGRDVLENLVTACEPCNNGKAATAPDDWLIDEVQQSADAWRGLPNREPDEDDYFEMHAYQEALYTLEQLPAGDVLSFMVKAYIAARPYRPTYAELLRSAGMMARQHGQAVL